MPMDSIKTQTHEALRRAIEIDRDTLRIAHETNDVLAVQEEQIREIGHSVEIIDKAMNKADRTAGKVNSCCGFGFWHWLKTKLCCMDGQAVAIRESQVKDLKKAEARAIPPPEVLSHEPIDAPELVRTDSMDAELSVIVHQLEELKQDARFKREELNLQNKILDTAVRQTMVTNVHVARVSQYVRWID